MEVSLPILVPQVHNQPNAQSRVYSGRAVVGFFGSKADIGQPGSGLRGSPSACYTLNTAGGASYNLGVSLGEFIAFMTVVVIPAIVIIYIANRFFRLRERKLEIEAMNAAEKAAQYAAQTAEMEQRPRVVEQIVTDSGVHTAAQIEALRQPPHINREPERAAAARDSPPLDRKRPMSAFGSKPAH